MKTALLIVQFLGSLASFVPQIANEVADAIKDGRITADEAESFARELSESRDLRVKIKGIDVLDDEAQAHLAACIARVVATAVSAATKE
jgi:hypothetical protein